MAGRKAVRPIDILTGLVLLYRFEGSRKRKLKAWSKGRASHLENCTGKTFKTQGSQSGRFQSEAEIAERTNHQVVISSQ